MDEKIDALAAAEAVTRLDQLGREDPEAAHSEADQIILAFAPADVAAAWERACERVGFWYAT